MYFIAAFGVLMFGFGIYMVLNPIKWSKGIILFSERAYFHWFEISSRFAAGSLFVIYSEQVKLSQMFYYFGFLMIAVSLGLIIVGSRKHIAFAKYTAIKFQPYFRYAGIAACALGTLITYLAVS